MEQEPGKLGKKPPDINLLEMTLQVPLDFAIVDLRGRISEATALRDQRLTSRSLVDQARSDAFDHFRGTLRCLHALFGTTDIDQFYDWGIRVAYLTDPHPLETSVSVFQTDMDASIRSLEFILRYLPLLTPKERDKRKMEKEEEKGNASRLKEGGGEGEPMTAPKVTADLKHLLDNAKDHDLLDVNIFVRGEFSRVAPMSETAGTGDSPSVPGHALDVADVVEQLKSSAASAQAGLLDFLGAQSSHAAFTDDDGMSVMAAAPAETFWITNAVGTRVTAGTLREILSREDVQFVDLSRHIPIDELIDARAPAKKKPGPAKKAPAKAADRGKPKNKAKPPDGPPPGQAQVAWSVQHINAPHCWQLGLTGKGILVAMVDTGVNYNHPDLTSRMWKGGAKYPKHGYDFENSSNDPSDDNGHGTATAGQVAGDGTSGEKTGVAPEATILAIRVGGVERSFWKGLQFALDQKAKVISMSMTWKYPSSPDYPGWRRVCQTILAAGVLHANSIGNQGNDLITYPVPFNIATPGNCPPPWLHPDQKLVGDLSSPISVGATDSADNLAAYSGHGPAAWTTAPYNDYPYTPGNVQQIGLLKPDVCAPGPGTRSCNYLFPSQPGAKPYRDFGGTSAATPHVGGCLALLAQACVRAGKPIIPARVQEALEQTARHVVGQKTAGKKENDFGAGRVDVYEAYQYGKNKGWW